MIKYLVSLAGSLILSGCFCAASIAQAVVFRDNNTGGAVGATATGINATAGGATAQASGTGSTAVGQDSQALNINSTAIGQVSRALGINSSALGAGAKAVAPDTVAVGTSTQSTGPFATSVGSFSSATSLRSTAIGAQSQAIGASSTSVGAFSGAAGQGSVAILFQSQALGTNSVAIGTDSLATGDNSVAIGQGSQANQANTVSVGAPGGERRLVNVAPGVALTDGVNVSQLTGMGSSLVNQTNNYTDQQVSTGLQTANAFTNQRFAQSISYTDSRAQQLNNRISTVEKSANQGVAAAVAMLTTIRTPSPGKTTVNIGAGYYGGQAATALAMAHRSRSGKWQGVAAMGIPTTIVSGANIAAAASLGFEF